MGALILLPSPPFGGESAMLYWGCDKEGALRC